MIKLLAKRCGFSRIKPETPNIPLETPMEEPAFRLLRQADREADREAGGGAQGLAGAAGPQIPGADGLSAAQRAEQQAARNAAVVAV
ncbi:MAG: hypothetical protein VKM97_06130 [Cyanobacteriota bacterium]|nr:hypothetical protein [Cyanobacteriota bacterium]